MNDSHRIDDRMIGQILGHFRTSEQFGIAGMGVAFRAILRHLNCSVAVNRTAPHRTRRRYERGGCDEDFGDAPFVRAGSAIKWFLLLSLAPLLAGAEGKILRPA